MEEKRKRGLTIRLGPLGLSLLAACITAIGVAAVSMAADSGSGSSGNGSGSATAQGPPPGGGPGVMTFRGPNLSAADRQKMEDFRKCMDANGAPAPPDPSNIDPSKGPPKPPSAADREKVQKAYEACKDKLPTDMQHAGPPGIGTLGCGPPPGAPPPGQQQNQNQDQSNDSGTSSNGSSS